MTLTVLVVVHGISDTFLQLIRANVLSISTCLSALQRKFVNYLLTYSTEKKMKI